MTEEQSLYSELHPNVITSLEKVIDVDLKSNILDTIVSIPFLRSLVNIDRKTAKELERDSEGKIIVNITQPHILEDMDFFRERAIYFKRNGQYIDLVKNTHPHSAYMRFWKEEERRCREGLIRPSDGEWIPGVYYWFLNYCPMQQAISDGDDDAAAIRGERIHDFPRVWDGHYLWFHYLHQAFEKHGKHAVNMKTRGRGYEQPHSAIIKTLGDDLTMGTVKVGDLVLTPSGIEAPVIDKFYQGVKDVYEIEFSDGRKVECGENHLWAVYKNHIPSRKRPYVVLSLKDIMKDGLYYNTKQGYKVYKYKLPEIHPVLYEQHKELPIHPYLLGALLGDGSMSTPSIKIASSDPEIIDNIRKILGPDYSLNRDLTTTNNHLICYEPAKRMRLKNSPLKKSIIDLNLNVSCKHKFIPDIYKRSSIEARVWLIKGLMDTDGHINEDGGLEFTNTNERLVDDMADVLRSLGVSCKKAYCKRSGSSFVKDKDGIQREIKRNDYYRLYIYSNKNVFCLSRKAERVNRKRKCNTKPFIKNISLVRQEESSCILIDSEEHVYLTNDFVPTHNSHMGAAIMSCNYYMYPRSNSFITANDTKYIYGGDGILDKTWDNLNFIDNNTPWKKSRDYIDLKDKKRASYRDPKTKTERGYKSQIIGITTGGDPERVRGLRGKVILNEEAGKYPNLLTAYAIERPSVEQGRIAFGQIITWGTGGSEGADFEGIKTLFTQPNGYRIYGLPNVFDKKRKASDYCGFYHGEYLNREGCMDSNGNSDVIKALAEILRLREDVRKGTTDPNALIREKADRSITPEEAMMKREGSLFNIEDLKSKKAEILTDTKLLNSSWCVKLTPRDGRIDFSINHDHRPIREFPIRETRGMTGSVEIWEMPIDNASKGTYIAGCDPYDDDIGTSLGSVFIMNRLTKRIVAEYSGRPDTAEQFYETVLRLLRFYNATCNYENNKKGMFQYFDKMNSTYLLADNPQILKDMEISKSVGFGNTLKGTNTTKAVNSWGNSLIKGYLMGEAYGREGDRNWNTIPSVCLLDELIAFDPENGNYDRVSALKMLLIYEADLHRYAVLDPDDKETNKRPDIDKFFLRHRGKLNGFEMFSESSQSKKIFRR